MDDDLILLDNLDQHGLSSSPGYTSATSPFQPGQLYETLPLSSGSRNIRVLDLHDAPTYNSPLYGNLRVVALQDCPRFAALSYVWGLRSSSEDDIITCDDCALRITKNCRDALLALRHRFGSLNIWVDAICINQEDNIEKASQIPLMEEIYTWAYAVYIWLGPSSDKSDRAIRWLSKASTFTRCPIEVPWHDGQKSRNFFAGQLWHILWLLWTYSIRCTIGITASRVLLERSFWRDGIAFDDFQALLRRDWTERAWTFQEVILASNPIFVCGGQTISLGALYGGLKMIGNFRDGADTSGQQGYKENLARILDCPIFDTWSDIFEMWAQIPRPTRWNGILFRASPTDDGTEDFRCSLQDEAKRSIFHYCPLALRTVLPILAKTTRVLQWIIILLFIVSVVFKMPISWKWVPFFWGNFALSWLCAWLSFNLQSVYWFEKTNDLLRVTKVSLFSGIMRALRVRKATVPQDRAFALYGMVSRLGLLQPLPDYSKSLGCIYQDLFVRLVAWEPALVNLLLDTGNRLLGAPSWVPDWSTAEQRLWLEYSFFSRPEELERFGRAIRLFSDDSRIPSANFNGNSLEIKAFLLESVSLSSGEFPDLRAQIPEAGGLDNQHIDPDGEIAPGLLQTILKFSTWIETICADAKLPYNSNTMSEAVADAIAGRRVGSQDSAVYNDAHRWYRLIARKRGLARSVDTERFAAGILVELQKYPRAMQSMIDACTHLVRTKRCLFLSAVGNIGTGPVDTREGDVVAIFQAVAAPLILRKQCSQKGKESAAATAVSYQVVGPAFVCGLETSTFRYNFNPDLGVAITLV